MNESLIDLRAWRQFVAVAEELHFGRAARRLHMTQPPVTQAIAQLEKTLGVVLFDRTRRRVALTPAGEALLPDVRELLARAQALPARARAAAAGQVGRVRIAFVSTVGFEQLPDWVREFRVLCPEVALELVEATGDVQLEAFARGEIDAGLMLHSPGAAPPGLARLAVSQEPLVLALPQRHALASAQQLPLAEVLAEPLVIFPRRIVPSLHDGGLRALPRGRARAAAGAGGDPDADHRQPGLGRHRRGLGARERHAVPARGRGLPGRRRVRARGPAPRRVGAAALRNQPGVAGGGRQPGARALHRVRAGAPAGGRARRGVAAEEPAPITPTRSPASRP